MLVLFIYFQNNTTLSKIVHFLCLKNKIKEFDRLFKLKILKIEISHLFQRFILNKACAFLRKNMKWTHYILRSSLVFVIKKHYMQRTSIFFVESNAFAALRVYFKVRNAQFKRKPCSRQYIFGDGIGSIFGIMIQKHL